MSSRYITGTIAQLAGKITVNNNPVTELDLRVLTRLFSGSQFVAVGSVRKSGLATGRPSVIWQVDTESATWFESVPDACGVLATDDTPTEQEVIEYAKTA